ncbi:Glycerophosphocholine phosphodiesterase [Mycoemilia scoparia]|uniref:Glycerophosphocholine phosphodiesterase n=1 Tax=Mycoemilia scoparia TaxID=417184 RepID=A0A9W8DW23_9FUNG|nr:Glycerophosphocholine phosphodiesterase [Mycoemilia scoparia]
MSLPLINVETLGWSFFGIELERILAEYHLIFSKGLNELPDQSLHDERARVLSGVHESLNKHVDSLVAHFMTALPAADIEQLRSIDDLNCAIDSIESCLFWTESLVKYAWRAQRDVYPYNPKGVSAQTYLPPSITNHVRDIHAKLTDILTNLKHRAGIICSENASHNGHHNNNSGENGDGFSSTPTPPSMPKTTNIHDLMFWNAKIGIKYSDQLCSAADSIQDIVKPDITSTTAIHYAAEMGNLDILRRAVDVDVQKSCAGTSWLNIRHDTPLAAAARAGQVDAIKFLLQHPDKFDTLESIPSAIFVAAHLKNESALDVLLSQVKLIQAHLPMILQSCCFYGHLSVLKALIEDEAFRPNLDAKGSYGFTPLHLATLNGHYSIIQLLLENGCERDVISTSHVTPLDIAAYLGYRQSVEMLSKDHSANSSPTSSPSESGSHGADPTESNRNIYRPPWHKRPRHVTYGHETIPTNSTVYVSPGTNDRRRIHDVKPLIINKEAIARMLEARALPKSTHMLMMITAENETEEKSKGPWVLDLDSVQVGHREWIPAAYFHTSEPNKLVIHIALVTLMDHLGLTKPKHNQEEGSADVLAESVFQIPELLTPRHPKTPNVVQCYCSGTIPVQQLLVDRYSRKSVGTINLELIVAKPYTKTENYPNGILNKETNQIVLSVPEWAQSTRQWKLDGSTQLYGHRGSGMNQRITNAGSKLQLGENTTLSMIHAVRSGAAFVEFDVQLTRDSVPIIYHDWNVSETGLDVHVNSLTLEQFIQLNSKHPRVMSKYHRDMKDDIYVDTFGRTNSVGRTNTAVGRKRYVSDISNADGENTNKSGDKNSLTKNSSTPHLNAKGRSNSFKSNNNNGTNAFIGDPTILSAKYIDIATAPSPTSSQATKPMKYKGNSSDTIQGPFATLDDLFRSVPEDIGFDIEVKYPMQDEADESEMWVNFELNWFLDRILDVVFSHIKPKQTNRSDESSTSTLSGIFNRPIIFTSFHPEVCLLLAHKLGTTFPVLFLTDAGISVMADTRCNGLSAAVRFAEWARLGGCVSEVTPIYEAPRVVSLVQQYGLALCTYGTKNNEEKIVRLQQKLGVDSVIVDSVKAMRLALDENIATPDS